MKKPTKCTTPKKDRTEYTLTAKDIRTLTALVKEANDILSYYMNMPENKTGCLEAYDGEKMDTLYEAVEDLKLTLDDISLK